MSSDSRTSGFLSWFSPTAILFMVCVFGAIGIMSWVGPATKRAARSVSIEAPWVTPQHVKASHFYIPHAVAVSLSDLIRVYEESPSHGPVVVVLSEIVLGGDLRLEYVFASDNGLVLKAYVVLDRLSTEGGVRACDWTVRQITCEFAPHFSSEKITALRYAGIGVAALIVFVLVWFLGIYLRAPTHAN